MKKNTLTTWDLGIKVLLPIVILSTSIYAQQTNKINFIEITDNKPFPQPVYQNNLGTFRVNLKNYNVEFHTFKFDILKYFNLNENHQLIIENETLDNFGFKRYTFQHYYNDFKVEGNIVFIEVKDNKVTNVYGQLKTFDKLIDVNNIKDIKVKDVIYKLEENDTIYDFSEMENVIVKFESKDEILLKVAKKINVYSEILKYNQTIYLDAVSGEILYKISNFCTADTPSNSSTLYRGVKQITVDSYNGSYRLKDNARNIHTLDATSLTGKKDLTNGEFVGWSEILNQNSDFTAQNLRPAVEVHWGMSKTYDYYKNIHNRFSYDNNHSILRNYYDPPYNVMESENAGAYDDNNVVAMMYGNGGYYFTPVVALDVAGHEFSHLVVGRNGSGGLIYQGESGAMNESFADIFGAAIEFYVNDQPNWTIGEGLFTIPVDYNYLRNMQNPNLGYLRGREQPDTYKGNYWADTTSGVDNGGVHTNSGVGNYWFYLLSEGGNGINDLNNAYYVNGITIQKAEKIAYAGLMNGLSPSATYLDMYNSTILAAENLYGVGSDEWEQTVNAWYAVGIGDAPASVKNIDMQTKLKIYPNPVNDGVIYIDSELENNTSVEIFDISGKKVTNSITLDYKTSLDVSNFKAGIYVLKFKSSLGEYSHKIAIK